MSIKKAVSLTVKLEKKATALGGVLTKAADAKPESVAQAKSVERAGKLLGEIEALVTSVKEAVEG